MAGDSNLIPETRALNPAYLEALYRTVNGSPSPSELPRVVSVGADSSRIELDIYRLQTFGMVRGGFIATLVDTATFWAAFGASRGRRSGERRCQS